MWRSRSSRFFGCCWIGCVLGGRGRLRSPEIRGKEKVRFWPMVRLRMHSNGLNRRTGIRNRCAQFDSGNYLAPEHLLGGNPVIESGPPRPPYPSISTEAPVSAQDDGSSARTGGCSSCENGREQSRAIFLNHLAFGEQSRLIFLNHLWIGNWRHCHPRVFSTCPARARFNFGDGRVGEARLQHVHVSL